MELGFLDRTGAVLVLVDVQDKFKPFIFEFSRVVKNVKKLVEGFRVLNVPILVTEQYPQGLGRTVAEVRDSLGEFNPIEKTAFSCFDDEKFISELDALGRKDIVLAGIEAHVCILKTALEGISRGFRVHIPVDCISSIRESDSKIAVERLKQAGAFMASSEMLLFQLLEDSKQPEFKELGEVVRKYA